MIPHGANEMQELGLRCPPSDPAKINNWLVDTWDLEADDVDLVAALYRATLVPDIGYEMEQEILSNGVSVADVLTDAEHARDLITRSDATELTAVTAFVAADDWPEDNLFMPNVPKMSRSRSDSGFDAMSVRFGGERQENDLSTDDVLFIGSVKHTVTLDASGVRYELVKSVSRAGLPLTYLGRQLVVLHGTLIREGTPLQVANRVIKFLGHVDDSTHVKIFGATVIDPRAADSLTKDLRNLPELEDEVRWLRIITIPDLPSLHDRCA